MPRQQNYFFTVLFLSFFRLFFSTRISLALFHVLVFLYEQPVPCSFLYLPFSRYSVAVFFSFENHRFRSVAALLPNLHSVVMMFVVVVSLCCLSYFLRLPCEASVPERRKNVDQTTREVCSILFFLETNRLGAKARRREGNLPYPTLPYSYPYFHFSGSTRFLLLLLFLFVCFFSVSKAKNVVFVCFIFLGNAFYAFSYGYLLAACIRGLPE